MSRRASHRRAHGTGAEGMASRAEPAALKAAAEGSPRGLQHSSEVGDASRLGLERGARRGNLFSSLVAQASLAGKGERVGRNSVLILDFTGLRRSAGTLGVRVAELGTVRNEAGPGLSDPATAALPAKAAQRPPPPGC